MHQPSADSDPKPALEYEQRNVGISRRQYRWLLLLTLLNTVLLGGFVVGPTIGPMVRNQWNQYQVNRARQLAAQQRMAYIQRLAGYNAPAGKVMYEEDPDRAAALLASDATFKPIPNVQVPYFTPRPWQCPVFFDDPSLHPQGNTAAEATLFAHELTSRSGQRWVVRVTVMANQSNGQSMNSLSPTTRAYEITTQRGLTAAVITDKGQSGTALLELYRSLERSTVLWTKTSSWENGKVEFKPANMFRFFAGQVDSADPSHFTIDYELDGKRGTIDGHIANDGRVSWSPRVGRIVEMGGNGRRTTWDPLAEPATQPPAPH